MQLRGRSRALGLDGRLGGGRELVRLALALERLLLAAPDRGAEHRGDADEQQQARHHRAVTVGGVGHQRGGECYREQHAPTTASREDECAATA